MIDIAQLTQFTLEVFSSVGKEKLEKIFGDKFDKLLGYNQKNDIKNFEFLLNDLLQKNKSLEAQIKQLHQLQGNSKIYHNTFRDNSTAIFN